MDFLFLQVSLFIPNKASNDSNTIDLLITKYRPVHV